MAKNSLAPIVIFAYNRPVILERTLKALSKNVLASESELIVFCDGPKPNVTPEDKRKISEVREIAHQQKWSKTLTVIENSENIGLANSIVEGVTQIVNKYGKIIVFEDDIECSQYTLKYLNDGLTNYETNEEVISIHAYNYPVKNSPVQSETFFMRGADCWGWATWRRGWRLFENDGQKLLDTITQNQWIYDFDIYGSYSYSGMLKETIVNNKSWAVKWYASAYIDNKLTLYPTKSLVRHIGVDGTNIKNNDGDVIGTELNQNIIQDFANNIEENVQMKQAWATLFKVPLYKKIMNKILRIVRE